MHSRGRLKKTRSRRVTQQGSKRRISQGSRSHVKKKQPIRRGPRPSSAPGNPSRAPTSRRGDQHKFRTGGGKSRSQSARRKKSRNDIQRSDKQVQHLSYGLRRTEEHVDLTKRPEILRQRIARRSTKERAGPQSELPVMTVHKITLRERPSTSSGRYVAQKEYDLRSKTQISGTRLLRRRSDCTPSDSSFHKS